MSAFIKRLEHLNKEDTRIRALLRRSLALPITPNIVWASN